MSRTARNSHRPTPRPSRARRREIPNFYKKPNGVFYFGDDEAGVLETGLFLNVRPEARFATQSGPMLVIDGAIHPAFIEDSTDRKPRNGVGVSSPTEVHFAISEDRVNFHSFARFFRDRLGCDDALFLDGGTAPGLYAPELGRDDSPGHGGYGPIIGVVEQARAQAALGADRDRTSRVAIAELATSSLRRHRDRAACRGALDPAWSSTCLASAAPT